MIAEESSSPVGDPAKVPESLDAALDLVPEIPSVWSRTLNVRTGAGYNDNLLQDDLRSEQSPSLAGGLEATLFRLPLDGRQVMAFVSGDYVYYPDGREVEHEASLIALGQAKIDLAPRWRVGLDLGYQFIDQVLDTSINQNTGSSELVRGHGLSARPSVTSDLTARLHLTLDAGVTRQLFVGNFDDYDYWESGPRLGLEQDFGNRSSVGLSYEWKWRDYDTRKDVDDIGEPKADLQIHEVNLAWQHNWDEARRWRTSTKLGFLANRDDGSGYFDYDRYQLSLQGRYVLPDWEVKARVTFSYYDFAEQVAVAGSGSRLRRGVDLLLRGERQVVKHLRLFLEYAREEVLSNRDTDEYRVNKVAAGIDCGF